MSNTYETEQEDGEMCPDSQYDEWKRTDIPEFVDTPETQAAKRFLLSLVGSEEGDDKVIPTRSRCSNRYEPYGTKDRYKTENRYDRRKDGHDRRGDFEQDDDFCRSGSTPLRIYMCDTISYADSIESLRREVENLIRSFRAEAAKNNTSYANFNQRFLKIERTIYPDHKVNTAECAARKMYNQRKLDTNGNILYHTLESIKNITKLMQESRDPVKIRAMRDTLKDLEIVKRDTLRKRSKIKDSLRERAPW